MTIGVEDWLRRRMREPTPEELAQQQASAELNRRLFEEARQQLIAEGVDEPGEEAIKGRQFTFWQNETAGDFARECAEHEAAQAAALSQSEHERFPG